jgi:tetratricopeptide (TPR) repeat protein
MESKIMKKSGNFLSILVPIATVFISSFCIMVLELAAARIIARHLGSSLYTWTAVIGIVLAGISIGNYLGGRIADRFNAKKALSVLFALASGACVLTIILNNIVGQWIYLWHLTWPVRVFTHVSLVFLFPSTLLGTISPVVAKMALERGLPTGRTIGDIYAWGAVGSIVGTFATGYFLILLMGTVAIIWMVGGILLLLAIFYWARFWILYIWAVVFIVLMTIGMSSSAWAREAGADLSLRDKPNPDILYEDESQYCYIAVERLSAIPDRRAFVQDKLLHSEMVMGDVLNLKYSYERIYAAATNILRNGKTELSTLVIGGGGYVFPRYIEELWPGSRVDVVEIDPAVTEAVFEAFGMDRDTTINTFNMDARNYVTQLLELSALGNLPADQSRGSETKYDFIYEDALNDYSIPYQLTTKEFNDKIARILSDDGVYMIELIDIFEYGLFVGAFLNTLDQTFDHICVVTEAEARIGRNTFVIIAADRQIDIENIRLEYPVRDMDLWVLSDSEIELLKRKARGIILTDDYAPVENLLTPVVLQSAVDLLVEKYFEQAAELKTAGLPDKSIRKYESIIKINPNSSIHAYNEIGMLQSARGFLEEAVAAFESALEYNDNAQVRRSVSNVHYNLGIALGRLGRDEQASVHLQKAIEGYRDDLTRMPGSANIAARLGNVLAELGDFDEAAELFRRAIGLEPSEISHYSMLARVLVIRNRYDEAIAELQKAVEFMSGSGNEAAAAKLQRDIEQIQSQKSQKPADLP